MLYVYIKEKQEAFIESLKKSFEVEEVGNGYYFEVDDIEVEVYKNQKTGMLDISGHIQDLSLDVNSKIFKDFDVVLGENVMELRELITNKSRLHVSNFRRFRPFFDNFDSVEDLELIFEVKYNLSKDVIARVRYNSVFDVCYRKHLGKTERVYNHKNLIYSENGIENELMMISQKFSRISVPQHMEIDKSIYTLVFDDFKVNFNINTFNVEVEVLNTIVTDSLLKKLNEVPIILHDIRSTYETLNKMVS